MTSILCRNGSTLHSHTSLVDSKICWGVIARPVTYTRSAAPVESMVTPKQLAYIKVLGGDLVYAAGLTMKLASAYITDLKVNPRRSAHVQPALSKRSHFITELIKAVPDGYFAVQQADGLPVTFMRISRPKHGNYKGGTKVQTQHGENLVDAWIWMDDRQRLFTPRGPWGDVEPQIMLLMADWQGSAMRYSRLIGKCCRCNKALTDERSRYFGIGPDCEQVWPWVIDAVNEANGS